MAGLGLSGGRGENDEHRRGATQLTAVAGQIGESGRSLEARVNAHQGSGAFPRRSEDPRKQQSSRLAQSYHQRKQDLQADAVRGSFRAVFQRYHMRQGDDQRPSAVGRVLEQLSWSRVVFRRYSRSDIRVINAHTVAVLPVCYLLSRRLGAKLIYDTHELETEVGTSTGMQRWIFKVIERSLIARCDAVFVTSQGIADWYQRRYRGVRPIVIRNISDPDASGRPVDLRTRLSVPADNLLFIFTGSVGEGRNIPAILGAFTAPAVNAHVVFLGSGGQFDSLVSEYCARHPNIHRLPAVPRTEVVHYTAGCDAGLCLTEPSCLSHKLALPNKAFEYAQASLPFFFTDLPEIDRLLGPAFADWRVDDPARNLAEAIRALTANAIEEARANMARLRIPSWDEEAATMIAAYFALGT
jgi:glycosyltransferase involved in cell wall biosynthesis